MPTSKQLLDARKRIEKQLESVLDEKMVREIVESALETKRRVWGDFNCKHCGRAQRHLVEIPDTVAVTKVLEVLLNQSKGRPTEQAQDQSVTVERNVYVVEDSDA